MAVSRIDVAVLEMGMERFMPCLDVQVIQVNVGRSRPLMYRLAERERERASLVPLFSQVQVRQRVALVSGKPCPGPQSSVLRILEDGGRLEQEVEVLLFEVGQ